MRKSIRRSIWGIQRKSFDALVKYLQKKFNQKKIKLNQKMDDIRTENVKIKNKIEFFQSPQSSELVDHTPIEDSYVKPNDVDDSLFSMYHYFHTHFKKRVFGLNQKMVSAHIKKIKSMQEDELQELRNEFDQLLQEREELLQELSHYQTHIHYVDEAATSTDLVVEKELEEEIVETEKELKVEEPIAETANEMAVEEWKKSMEEELREKLFAEMREQVKKELTSETGDHWVLELKETLKQEILEEYRPLFREAERAKENALRPKVVSIRNKVMPKLIPQKKYERLTVGGTDFWGEDIESLLFQPNEWQQESYYQVQAYDTIADNDTVDRKSKNNIETPKSPAIEDQAFNLRKRYIVGKIAGEDLKDSSGKIIIEKNDVITEEVMKKADKEGKLAELIVNMNVPGLGE